ncbi:CBS domain containing membrane protein [Leptothrix cholodnii SP-6]|uniref:CBS domain containing membrane protein n=1 Tax=Leptothrix cholodnii (strain ATCC 51168 / LMG 8142 / SP-6) TaxID=395495 RepID=B1Y7Z9_LEPCP|nr:HPP family protein [Leptothrix cholodnii]ACB33741.1 CBS domain containing membrane protein [Leptothrix cholodnii SP-6]
MSQPPPVPVPLDRLRAWLRALQPAQLAIDGRERRRVVAGGALGIVMVALLSHAWPIWPGLPWLVAPLGASAVLVFGLPASPLAQPWSVVGGNTLSALVGVSCVHLLPTPELAASVAVAGAIAVMMAARCLHPPGGAAALLAVMTGMGDWRFALAPVALNSALLVAAGMLYNPLTGRRYPHAQDAASSPAKPAGERAPGFSDADLDAVLARYNQVLDIPRDDLRTLLEQSELEAHRRRLDTLRCRDIMSADPLTVAFGTPLHEAWQLLRGHRIKALPVVDRYGFIVGIVTQADFLRSAELDHPDGLDRINTRLGRLLRPTPGINSDKPEVVGQIMSRQVRVASAERPLNELVPLFSSTGHHHIPIIGERNRLVGIITQTDLVAALARPGGV